MFEETFHIPHVISNYEAEREILLRGVEQLAKDDVNYQLPNASTISIYSDSQSIFTQLRALCMKPRLVYVRVVQDATLLGKLDLDLWRF